MKLAVFLDAVWAPLAPYLARKNQIQLLEIAGFKRWPDLQFEVGSQIQPIFTKSGYKIANLESLTDTIQTTGGFPQAVRPVILWGFSPWVWDQLCIVSSAPNADSANFTGQSRIRAFHTFKHPRVKSVDCDVHVGRPLSKRAQPIQYAALVCKLEILYEGQVYVEAHHLQTVFFVTWPIWPYEHDASGKC